MLRDLKLPIGLQRLKRLERLLEDHATLLETETVGWLRPTRFNLKSWASPCGTQACACGLMAMQPEAQAEGLTLEKFSTTAMVQYGHEVVFQNLRYCPPGELKECQVGPCALALGEVGMYAARAYFDIESHQAEWLFNPDAYSPDEREGPKAARAVAQRVRELVAEKVAVL